MKRRMWLKNPITGAVWDLLPNNPHDPNQQGCAFLKIKGMGYQQNVTQEQIVVDYFISHIKSKNVPITGILYFNGDKHFQAFQAYVGDFGRQFDLYYSPNGEYQPYDEISSIFHKPIIISQVDKTEKDEYGYYECSTTFIPQADVWKRNVYYGIELDENSVGEALVYPYTYSYVYGGRNIFSVEIENSGRESGCLIKVTNTSDTDIGFMEWYVDHTYEDSYGELHTETQRAKWYTDNSNIILKPNYTLYVDSNETSQEAKVIRSDGTSESVVDWQEPSYEYINFIRIKNGNNKIVFYSNWDKIRIEVLYQEQKELI